MKILYTNFQSKDGGGHVTYILSLIKALADKHDLSVATPNTSRLYRYSNQVAGVKVVNQWFTSRINKMLPEVKQIRDLLKQERYDLVHISGSADHRHLMFACAGLKHRPKLVFTKHNDHSVKSFGNQLRARWGTDHSIAVSDYVNRLMINSDYKLKPITTIRHGINTDYFSPVNIKEKNEQRLSLLGADHESLIVFGSSGGTDYDKGWLDLLEAISLLPSKQRNIFRVIIAGSQPNEEKLAKVAQLGVSDLVVFPGLLDDVRSVLAACDIGFVLSYREALSYACREVMALGLPALVSDVGGLPENVSHNVNGWVVPAKSPDNILPVLQNIIANPYIVSAMGSAARATAQYDFALTPFIEKTMQVYRDVLQVD